MKFGIFFELSVPRPFDGDAERLVIENALPADQLRRLQAAFDL